MLCKQSISLPSEYLVIYVSPQYLNARSGPLSIFCPYVVYLLPKQLLASMSSGYIIALLCLFSKAIGLYLTY
jgi:hypothetical protein